MYTEFSFIFYTILISDEENYLSCGFRKKFFSCTIYILFIIYDLLSK